MNIPRFATPRLAAAFLALASCCSSINTVQANAVLDGLSVPDAPNIPHRTFKVISYGAVGDGKTMNTKAIQKAIHECNKQGGGIVVIPEGHFLTGPIELESRCALKLEQGAVLQAPQDFSLLGYPDPLPTTQAEMDGLKKITRPLITASGADDIAILGAGTIDGGGAMWWAHVPRHGNTGNPIRMNRPNLVVFVNCNRVHLAGITLQNSPQFHFVPQFCQNVFVDHINIHSPADSPNTDGIDPANSRTVLIRGCTIDTGDDDVALKAGGKEPCQDITVTDCTIRHGHGISIGSETDSGVRNFLVQNCTFENTGTALRIKSARSRGGKIVNVLYRNISMKSVDAAISISFYYYDREEMKHPEFKTITSTTPSLQHVRFTDITCEDAVRAGEICGLPETPLLDVSLKNVQITSKTGLTIQDASGITLQNVSVLTSRTPRVREPKPDGAVTPVGDAQAASAVAPQPSASPTISASPSPESSPDEQ
ncbi:MAG: glycoside hydrolase family 28 protein [Chthoniobacteraceae bacterium]